MSELKPCPFCGGPARATRYSDGTLYAGCQKCDVGFLEDSDQETVAAWNRRATPAPIDAYPAHGDDWLRLGLIEGIVTERLRVIAANEAGQQAEPRHWNITAGNVLGSVVFECFCGAIGYGDIGKPCYCSRCGKRIKVMQNGAIK